MTEEKKVYTAGEVALRCSLAPYILNYWAIHFPGLKGPDGRMRTEFGEQEVALVWRIKQLLYTDHLTIEQARRRLEKEKSFPVQYGPAAAPKPAPVPAKEPEKEAAAEESPQPAREEKPAEAPAAEERKSPDAAELAAAVSRLNAELAAAREEVSLWKRRYGELSRVVADMSADLKALAGGLKSS